MMEPDADLDLDLGLLLASPAGQLDADWSLYSSISLKSCLAD